MELFNESVIYEEEIEFHKSNIMMEKALNIADYRWNELLLESVYDDLEANAEKGKALAKKALDAFKTFIIKCKDYIQQGINKIIDRINDALLRSKININAIKLDNMIKEAEKRGMTTVVMPDIHLAMNTIISEYDAYRKLLQEFSKRYIRKGANPRDAERMVAKYKDITKKYDEKIKSCLNDKKQCNINDAKFILESLKNTKSKNTGENSIYAILVEQKNMCDQMSRMVESAVNSIDKFSDDTGYIQNAKGLQDMIHNSCIMMHLHSSEYITMAITVTMNILNGINTIRYSEGMGNKKNYRRGGVYNLVGTASDVAHSKISDTHRAMRKNDLDKWINKGENNALSFDNRKATEEELRSVNKQKIVAKATVGLARSGVKATTGLL